MVEEVSQPSPDTSLVTSIQLHDTEARMCVHGAELTRLAATDATAYVPFKETLMSFVKVTHSG